MQNIFTFNSNQVSIVKMKIGIYCWQMSKLGHNFLNQQIFPSLFVNILSYFIPITFFSFHEQQICHFYHSPSGGLLEDD